MITKIKSLIAFLRLASSATFAAEHTRAPDELSIEELQALGDELDSLSSDTQHFSQQVEPSQQEENSGWLSYLKDKDLACSAVGTLLEYTGWAVYQIYVGSVITLSLYCLLKYTKKCKTKSENKH